MTDTPMKSRRQLLAAAAGAAVVVAAATSDDAAAANGSALVIGQANTGSAKTQLDTSGTITDDGAFVVSAPDAAWAIEGASTNGYGLYGNGAAGVVGTGGVGGVFSGTTAAVNLDPLASAGAPSGAAFKGDLTVDAAGVLWLCVGSGTPGTWIKVSHGGNRPLDQPQRVYDSRNDAARGIFPGNSSRTIDIVSANVGVPAQAVAILCNLTVTETTAVGFLTAWPEGPRPITSNLNWSTGGITIANSATVRLGNGGVINIYVEHSDAQVIVDIAGYVL